VSSAAGRLGRQAAAIARLDLAEVLRSRWLAVSALAYAVLAIVFVSVGQREAPLLGFTGSARVLFSMSHALILLLPLVALTATAPAIGRARDDGSLELLFSQPLGRGAYLVAITAVRTLAILAPVAALFVAVALWGLIAHGQPVPWAYLGRALAVLAALGWAFAGIGFLISTRVRHPVRTITYVILIWAAAVALLDAGLIGVLLRWRLDAHVVFALAAANPVEDARLALLSGVDRDLSTLGPVGFYLAGHLGDGALYALGVAIPFAWGTLCWLAALVHFRRTDIV
jgi:ABC-type transport system involved in multi-copper enzyme maturation permease subunit